VLDETTEFGRRATRRLHESIIGWLTTVAPDGGPRPIPVWFLWNGDRSILVYSRPEKRKLANIAANPNVSLNLDSDGIEADIVVC
jgi:PPOX class probable F420-dependent enzyme